MKKIYGCSKWASYPSFTSSWWSCATTRMPSNELHSHATYIIQVMINFCNLSYSQHKCIHKAEMCIYNRKMQALLAQEIQPFLTKPTQRWLFLLKIVLLWIILTHIDDGISSSMSISLSIYFLCCGWVVGWNVQQWSMRWPLFWQWVQIFCILFSRCLCL